MLTIHQKMRWNRLKLSAIFYETIYPFRSAVRIEQEIAKQEKAKQKEYLEHLFVKRKEIETNLLLIQDYINKATL